MEEHAGQHQPDPVGAETAPVASPASRPTPEIRPGQAPPPPPSPGPPPVKQEQVDPAQAYTDAVGEEYAKLESGDGEGLLAGTSSELASGTGAAGTHPAPAAVRDPERGGLHVAGESPAGSAAPSEASVGETSELRSGDVDPQARERLNEIHEPEQIDIERPDLGTE